eukprot:CAMPEP_0117675870 /NCGR_PEP_ID=MMETSP0804-20121206/15847_1 /TAXON_ID=1074897 /ORGANISM="Tetraselmis astigmatica, Strain CCMP880" /LENGTH=116 /DNA_ID=CAMNT_0005484925 /DNA_START=245 /DNA_END=595 /DNA_ORIENTATION=-
MSSVSLESSGMPSSGLLDKELTAEVHAPWMFEPSHMIELYVVCTAVTAPSTPYANLFSHPGTGLVPSSLQKASQKWQQLRAMRSYPLPGHSSRILDSTPEISRDVRDVSPRSMLSR